MPVTLAQAKLNTTDDIDVHVINEFQKQGWLVSNLPFLLVGALGLLNPNVRHEPSATVFFSACS